MNAVQAHILARLAQGGPCSGEGLAVECGMSRAAVAKHVRRLREAGWPIQARRGVGYRLAHGLRPLCRSAIADGLAAVDGRVMDLEVCPEVDSTNSRLADVALPADGRAQLCIAEHQTAGRGRRGRSWHASAGGGITFSLSRLFERPPAELLGLGLVAGVAVAEALAAQGLAGLRLKWPNDIQVGDAKLGGILVELAGEAAGPTRAIVGIGLNYDLADAPASLTQAAADVRGTATPAPDRSALAGALMAALIRELDEFGHEGLAPYLERWTGLDALAGRNVEVEAPGGPVAGVAAGLAPDGALRLTTASGERRFLSGDVSVRARAPCG